MVKEVLDGIKKELNNGDVKLCATGGSAKWFLDNSKMKMKHIKSLTLLGIGYIYELNN